VGDIYTKQQRNNIYIHDLKVANYEQLYTLKADDAFIYTKFTPAQKENKDAEEIDLTAEQNILKADEVLKNGLWAFKNGQFENALYNFNMLLKHNSNDVNSAFYSALCYYNLNKADKAIILLTPLTENPNSFYEEAKWNLALSFIAVNDLEKAKILFQEIISEKGFYSIKAKEKIKNL